MPLSDFACKNAKPKDKPYRLADGDGLYLLVQKNGSKLWQLRYRYLEKENILSFGKYPLVSLLDARERRDDAKRLLIAGINPSTKRKEEKAAALTEARTTFGLIAEEYVKRMEERDAAVATITKTKWLLEDLASPLAKRPIKEITPAEILQLLQKIEKSGRRETARRLRGVIGSVFRLAIVTLRAETDPTLALQGALQPPKANGRAAITDERKFGQLLVAIDEYDGWPTLKAALQFLALTCVRPGEVRGATPAPELCYEFLGATCISVNEEIAHGIPGERRIATGDLVNIDVSAEKNGYFADTGASFAVPPVTRAIEHLCRDGRRAMWAGIRQVGADKPLAGIGLAIGEFARKNRYTLVQNLASHGVGHSLHEHPKEIATWPDSSERRRMNDGLVFTVEPFLSMGARWAKDSHDPWTLRSDPRAPTVQYEHTVVAT